MNKIARKPIFHVFEGGEEVDYDVDNEEGVDDVVQERVVHHLEGQPHRKDYQRVRQEKNQEHVPNVLRRGARNQSRSVRPEAQKLATYHEKTPRETQASSIGIFLSHDGSQHLNRFLELHLAQQILVRICRQGVSTLSIRMQN